MATETGPKFWLQVRESYIIDNFEAMVDYLNRSTADSESKSQDLESTLDGIERLLTELNRRISSVPYIDELPLDMVNGKELTLKHLMTLYAAGILSFHKFGRNSGALIPGFVNLIARNGASLSNYVVKELWDVAIAAVNGWKFTQIGLYWNDVRNWESFNPHVAVVKFVENTRYRRPEREARVYYENHGLAVFGDELTLSAMNMDRLYRTPTKALFAIEGLLTVQVPEAEAVKRHTHEEMYAAWKSVSAACDKFRPSVVRTLGKYEDDDEIYVRVTSITGDRIHAESIDPDFERVESDVFTLGKDMRVPDLGCLIDELRVHDLLRVVYHPNESRKFNLYEVVNEYYIEKAESLANRKQTAVYVNDYSAGSLWMTDEGITLSVDNKLLATYRQNVIDDLEDAKDDHAVVNLKVYEKVNNYAKIYSMVEQPVYADRRFSLDEARHNFYVGYLEWCVAECPEFATQLTDCTALADSTSVVPFKNILMYITDQARSGASERYEYAFAARMLAGITGAAKDGEYLRLMMRYLGGVLSFSVGSAVKELEVPVARADNVKVHEWASIAESLRSYKVNAVDDPRSETAVSTAEKVAKLVKSANDLNGTISVAEQNNIKQEIARALDAEDTFVPLNSEGDNYGSESEVLEFKQSVVFPPLNRRRFAGRAADPEIQKWAVLKTVCGFMNSRFGGDLLIGVNDKGYATGVENDYDELFKADLIKAPDYDNYSRYLQDELKRAFVEYGTDRKPADIAFANVTMSREGADGKTVIRLRVRPNLRRAVRFNPDMSRPEGVEEAYVRRNNETLYMSAEMRANVEKDKMRCAR